ncbi:hypothetical protein L596_007277 [Steinernema carpocapsae]|uniref:SP-RING-type domain-containing protein n=1 Tax=Steinernema carpocapsae TaxID=34508 RepID=A0A4U5P8R3_STECR|nr:hypothetical protein L596_007277 [Steinernema carpocapsae]
MKISLLCPLGRTRMTMPAKGAECTHLQCFDLDMYLRMNEKRPTWKCAICDKVSTAYKLIIDQYFLDILQRAELSVSDVELLKDGSWRVIKVEAETLSSDDEDIVPCKITSSSTDPTRSSTITSNPSSSSASMLPADDDIIVLDSDDDIDVTPPPPPSASTTQTSDSDRNGTPVLLSPQNVSERSDISIICLDDSDGDVMPIPDTSSPASQMSNMLQMPTESSSVSLGEVSQALSNGHASSAGTPQTLMAALAPLMTQTSNPSTSNHMTSPMFAQSPYGALQPSVPTSFPWTGGAYNGMATSAVVPQVSQGFVQYDYNSFLNGNGRTNLNFDPVAQRNIQDTVAQLLGTISNNTQQSYYDRTS